MKSFSDDSSREPDQDFRRVFERSFLTDMSLLMETFVVRLIHIRR